MVCTFLSSLLFINWSLLDIILTKIRRQHWCCRGVETKFALVCESCSFVDVEHRFSFTLRWVADVSQIVKQGIVIWHMTSKANIDTGWLKLFVTESLASQSCWCWMSSDRALLVTTLLRFHRRMISKLAIKCLKRITDKHWIQNIHSIDDTDCTSIHHTFELIVRCQVAMAFYLRKSTLLITIFYLWLACWWLWDWHCASIPNTDLHGFLCVSQCQHLLFGSCRVTSHDLTSNRLMPHLVELASKPVVRRVSLAVVDSGVEFFDLKSLDLKPNLSASFRWALLMLRWAVLLRWILPCMSSFWRWANGSTVHW